MTELLPDTILYLPTHIREINRNNAVAEKNRGWSYAFGLGLVREYISDLPPSPFTDFVDELVYAKINGNEYGTNPLSVDDEVSLPSQFYLSQNYPNPFNPSTTIKYQLPQSNFVTLKVFDILGKEVAELVNEKKDAGTYLVHFNASTFSSGIYFYRLQTEHYSLAKKMLLLR